MREQEDIAYIYLDAVSDLPISRRSVIPNYYVSIRNIVEDPILLMRIMDEAAVEDIVSTREVMNNVDSDERSYSREDYSKRTHIFGEFARLASVAYVLELHDKPEVLQKLELTPRDFEYINSLDIDQLNSDYQEELDLAIEKAEPNVTAYLFGRDVLELDDININIRDSFYKLTTNIIYRAYQHLQDCCGQWIYAFESWYETDGSFTGSWEVDGISLYLKGSSITNHPEEMLRGRF